MAPYRPASARIFALSALLALIVNLAFFEALSVLTRGDLTQQTSKQSRRLSARLVPQRAPKKPKPPKPPPEEIKGQIVDLPPPEKELKPPKDAAYLSAHNTKTKKETKARKRDRTRDKRRGKRKVKKESTVQSPDSDKVQSTTMTEERERTAPPRATSQHKTALSGETRPHDDSLASLRESLLMPATNEVAAVANLQALSGGAASDDALLAVDELADSTSLNSRSFRYWGFFNRVKRRVKQHWRAGEAYRQNDPTGRQFGVKDRLTVLRVTLDGKGNVRQILVAKRSGADFLDDEARRALQSAGPFANPPVGLVDENGQITFNFGFLFEISNGKQRFFWKRL